MSGKAKVLRNVAFTVIGLFGLLVGLFAAGYAFEDPGGWKAAGMMALWLVPVVVLSIVAFLRPTQARSAFIGGTAVVALLTLVDSAFGIIPRDDWGPVFAITVFAAGVVLAFLGLHQPMLAGLLLVVLGLAQLAATVLAFATELADSEGPGAGNMLTTSSGVVVAPLLVGGLLFLLAGLLDHEPVHARSVRAS